MFWGQLFYDEHSNFKINVFLNYLIMTNLKLYYIFVVSTSDATWYTIWEKTTIYDFYFIWEIYCIIML